MMIDSPLWLIMTAISFGASLSLPIFTDLFFSRWFRNKVGWSASVGDSSFCSRSGWFTSDSFRWFSNDSLAGFKNESLWLTTNSLLHLWFGNKELGWWTATDDSEPNRRCDWFKLLAKSDSLVVWLSDDAWMPAWDMRFSQSSMSSAPTNVHSVILRGCSTSNMQQHASIRIYNAKKREWIYSLLSLLLNIINK